MLGGVVSDAHFITGHKQTQSNRICYFRFTGVLSASKGSNFQKLFEPCVKWQITFSGSLYSFDSFLVILKIEF